MPTPPKTSQDITGRTYNRWTVLSYFGPGPDRRGSLWVCRCHCGVIRNVLGGDLRRGNSKSCGCLLLDYCLNRTNNRYRENPEAGVWYQARARCTSTKHKQFHNYGGRGVTMCERWRLSFHSFLADMGKRPTKKHQLERLDNGKGYWCGKPECPECGPEAREPNCEWVTAFRQANNKRNNQFFTHDGITLTLPQWARKLGCKRLTLLSRLQRGWSVEKTLTTPTLSRHEWSTRRTRRL